MVRNDSPECARPPARVRGKVPVAGQLMRKNLEGSSDGVGTTARPRDFSIDRVADRCPLYPGHDGRSRSGATLRLFLWLS